MGAAAVVNQPSARPITASRLFCYSAFVSIPGPFGVGEAEGPGWADVGGDQLPVAVEAKLRWLTVESANFVNVVNVSSRRIDGKRVDDPCCSCVWERNW